MVGSSGCDDTDAAHALIGSRFGRRPGSPGRADRVCAMSRRERLGRCHIRRDTTVLSGSGHTPTSVSRDAIGGGGLFLTGCFHPSRDKTRWSGYDLAFSWAEGEECVIESGDLVGALL